MKLKPFSLFLALCTTCAAYSRTAAPAPPPAAPPQRPPTEIEKLVAPIALYPDPLIATILPASVYPLEIVQAARFVKDTNNLAKLDDQPWDDSVKAVSRIPAVIEMMNTNLSWTMDLGQAFLEQQEEVMNTVQSLRIKAQNLGTLTTTSQQVVVVTNTIVEKTVEQQIVYVTNTVVQIVPSNPQVIYVPTYNPYYVYYPPPVYYVGPPPIVTFAAGVTVGLILANNCNWHSSGIYVGHHGVAVWGGGSYHGHGDVNINVDRSVNINSGNINTGNINTGSRPAQTTTTSATAQKWQPDQSRLSKSGAPGSAATAQARGWSSGDPATRTATTSSRPSTASTANRPALSTQPARPAPSAQPTMQPSRPATSPAPWTTASRPSSSASAYNRPTTSMPAGQSAFGGVSNGQSARDYGSRGSASLGGGGGGGRSGGRR
jgi:hypothetical protein